MKRILTSVVAAALSVAWLPLCSQATTIIPTYVDGSGYTWDSVHKGVIQEAINEWEACDRDTHTINVTFDFTHDGTGAGSYLGEWAGSISGVPYGTDLYPWTTGVTHVIHFNVDMFSGTNYLWWDPTPTTSGDQPFAAWDALSVIRHELGHALGFTPGFYLDNVGLPQQTDKWTSHITGSTFNLSGTSISMASSSDLAHVLDGGLTAGNLMVPALLNGVRRGISTIDMDMLHLAYGYPVASQLLPGDADLNGTVNGADLNAVLSNYNKTGMAWSDGNFDDNGTVNGADLNIVLSNYNKHLSVAAAVPEPSTLWLAAAGLVSLLVCAWRRRR